MKINSYSPQYNQNKQYQTFKAFNANTAKRAATKVYDRSTSWMAYGIGKLASYKPVQKVVDFFKDKNYQGHLAAITGCVLSGFYMLDTARSKDIEKDQKLPLIINQGVVCGISTVGAYTLNNYLNKKLNNAAELFHISKIEDKNMQEEFLKCKADYSYIEKLQQRAKTEEKLKPVFSDLEKKFEFTNDVKVFVKDEMKKNKNDLAAKEFLKELKSIKKTADKEKADVVKELFFKKMKNSVSLKAAYNRASMNNAISKLSGMKNAGKLPNMINGFKTARSLMVFALIYRFASPVFATPIANKASEYLENKKHKTKMSA